MYHREIELADRLRGMRGLPSCELLQKPTESHGPSRSPSARACPLKIAAKVDAVDAEYFHTVIEPLLDHPLIEFLGEIGDGEKSAFLGNAQALLFPIGAGRNRSGW